MYSEYIFASFKEKENALHLKCSKSKKDKKKKRQENWKSQTKIQLNIKIQLKVKKKEEKSKKKTSRNKRQTGEIVDFLEDLNVFILFHVLYDFFFVQIDTPVGGNTIQRRPFSFMIFGCLVTCGYLWSLARIRRGCFSDQVSEL